jgi:hypothetical protein
MQFLIRSLSCGIDSCLDAQTLLCQLLVRVSLDTKVELVLPASGKRKMGMRINESRKACKALAIDANTVIIHTNIAMKSFLVTDKDDLAFEGGDATIFQKPDILESVLPLWDRTLAGQKLVAVEDCEVSSIHGDVFSEMSVCSDE